jgi:hypothetical protein
MNIETKFQFNDRVYFIHQAWRQYWEPCGFCGSKGYVFGANQKERDCPECYGRKGFQRQGEFEWLVDGPYTIGQVRVEITGEDEDSPDTGFSNYGPRKYCRKEEYMMKETGIGSGSIYDGYRCFASREEAQAACDTRNVAKGEGE